jgi:Outer membrane protein beta-barrel domain
MSISLSWYFFSPIWQNASRQAVMTSTCLLLSATAAFAETAVNVDIPLTSLAEITPAIPSKQADSILRAASSNSTTHIEKQDSWHSSPSDPLPFKEYGDVADINSALSGEVKIVNRNLTTEQFPSHNFIDKNNAEDVIKTPQVAINPAPTEKTIPLTIEQDLTFSRTWEVGDAIPVFNGLLREGTIAQSPAPSTPSTPVQPTNQSKKRNYVGFTVGSFLQIPAYGINAKIEVADNISVRPFIQYAKLPDSLLRLEAGKNVDVNVSGFIYGLSATYDFNVPKSDFVPYAGIGLANASGSATGIDGNNNNVNTSGFTSPVFVELGVDYNFTENVTLNLNYKFQDLGFLSIGAGYRF